MLYFALFCAIAYAIITFVVGNRKDSYGVAQHKLHQKRNQYPTPTKRKDPLP